MPGQANLITEHKLLIHELEAQLGEERPAAVVLDTLNKSMFGSESKDLDMSAYVRAAEAIRDAFKCVVIIVHHCGLDETRPRGHTSLPGAVDAQLAVVRNSDIVTVTVEMMRDGPEDTVVSSMVEVIEVGADENGKVLTSLIVKPSDQQELNMGTRWTKSLMLFRRALSEALLNSNEKVIVNGAPINAVDLEAVRTEFYSICHVDGDTAEEKQDTCRKRFARCVDRAQQASLIGLRSGASGRTVVWLAAAHEPNAMAERYASQV
jgi:hypothetical protein